MIGFTLVNCSVLPTAFLYTQFPFLVLGKQLCLTTEKLHFQSRKMIIAKDIKFIAGIS